MKYPEMMNMRYAVCDDETVLRQDIREKIALFSPGSVIVEFSSGKDLLESSEAFDIIFLDIGMEGIDGMQAAKELRKNGCTSAIIFVTAYGKYGGSIFGNSRKCGCNCRQGREPVDRQG